MLAFSEMLKSFTPIKNITSKATSFRKQIFEKIFDLILIILSIYIALNFEGWADKRNEHKKLIQYYRNFINEIAQDSVSIYEIIDYTQKSQKNIEAELKLLRNYSPAVEDTVVKLFYGLFTSQLFNESDMISYKAMILSGDIKLIKNISLKEELIKLQGSYEGIKFYEDMYLENFKNRLMPAFSDNFDLINQNLLNKDYFKKITTRNLVIEIYSLNQGRLEQYRVALENARTMLAMLRQEINS
jgi:hypothetical protein